MPKKVPFRIYPLSSHEDIQAVEDSQNCVIILVPVTFTKGDFQRENWDEVRASKVANAAEAVNDMISKKLKRNGWRHK